MHDTYWERMEKDPDLRPDFFDPKNKKIRLAWWDVATTEEEFWELHIKQWKQIVDELKSEMNRRVERRHYNNAIASLKVCQNQIETLMVEIRRFDSANRLAHDASIILGGLEAVVNLEPDMEEAQANMWEWGPEEWDRRRESRDKMIGKVKSEHKP